MTKKNKKAVEYDFLKNRSFFDAFIGSYGITTNDGSLVFPQLIFKKTKKTKTIKKLKCRMYQLPGNYLNSKSVAWFSEKKLRFSGNVFAKYLSFFTKSPSLLKQAKALNSLPIKIEVTLNTGFSVETNIKILDKIEEINCRRKEFKIPESYKIIKVKPQGLPMAEM